MSSEGRLTPTVFGTTFQNPVLLAAGTCGFGREMHRVTDLERLGGLVTKSVTLEPRRGNPPPRVTEFGAGMLNSVGLANPGAETVRDRDLPWLRDHLRRARVFVSVAGHTPAEYARIVETLDGADGFLGYEINLSCPNDTRLEGLPFALDPEAVREVVGLIRERTERPILAKLAPNDPRLTDTVRVAEDAGADGLTLVNTLPGLVLDPESGGPRLGAGGGGVSGPALRPAGVRAVAEAVAVTSVPILGVGGIVSSSDALEYLRAGATLVQVGTASFADPRAAVRIAKALERRRARGEGIPEGMTGDGRAREMPEGAGEEDGRERSAPSSGSSAPRAGDDASGTDASGTDPARPDASRPKKDAGSPVSTLAGGGEESP